MPAADHTARLIHTLALIPVAPEWTTAREVERRLLALGYAITLRTIERDLVALARRFPMRRTVVDQRSIQWSSMAGAASWITVPMPIGRAA
jgi:hypothetical protein